MGPEKLGYARVTETHKALEDNEAMEHDWEYVSRGAETTLDRGSVSVVKRVLRWYRTIRRRIGVERGIQRVRALQRLRKKLMWCLYRKKGRNLSSEARETNLRL